MILEAVGFYTCKALNHINVTRHPPSFIWFSSGNSLPEIQAVGSSRDSRSWQTDRDRLRRMRCPVVMLAHRMQSAIDYWYPLLLTANFQRKEHNAKHYRRSQWVAWVTADNSLCILKSKQVHQCGSFELLKHRHNQSLASAQRWMRSLGFLVKKRLILRLGLRKHGQPASSRKAPANLDKLPCK